jgi:hypothetical protein
MLLICALLFLSGLGTLFLLGAPENSTAAAVPSNASIYASLFVDPSVGQKRALHGLFGQPELEEAIDDETDLVARALEPVLGRIGLSYETDIEPHMGDEVAFFALPASSPPPDLAILIQTTDRRAVEERLAAITEIDGRRVRSMGGARLLTGGTAGFPSVEAFGMAKDFLVIATSQRAFQAVAETTTAPADSLARHPGFRAETGEARDDHLGMFFVRDVRAIDQLGSRLGTAFSRFLFGVGDRSFAGTLHAESDALVVESSVRDPLRLEASMLAGWFISAP